MFFTLKIVKKIGRITTATVIDKATLEDIDNINKELDGEGFYTNKIKNNEYTIYAFGGKEKEKVGSIILSAYLS